jgi:fibronectin-binding autotransporter adhesin
MAISGQQPINVGLPNESVGSDSLYVAFNKVNTNFTTLFSNSSPFNTFQNGNGISVNANSTTGIVSVTNTGVLSLTTPANSGISLSGSNGNIVISTTSGGGGGSGTVTSIGLLSNSSRITVSSSTTNPIVANGNFTVDLATTGVSPGTYTTPSSVVVDAYGRVTGITAGTTTGTVTSVAMEAGGTGISVTGGPVTTSGLFTIRNTGVTSIRSGGGVTLTGTTGDVTISVPSSGGTVTSVGVTSNTLTVTNTPVVSAGSINVELAANVAVTGRLNLSGSENLADAAAANLEITASYFSTGASGETNTLAAGTNGLVKTFMMLADGGGDRVITVTNAGWKTSGTGTMTFGDIGAGCTLQYINSKWFCVGNNGVVFA